MSESHRLPAADAERILRALSRMGFRAVDNSGNPLRVESGRDLILFSRLRFARRGSPAVDVFMKPPLGTFEKLWERRRRLVVADHAVHLFSIVDLLAARRKYMRTKDIARLEYLEDLARNLPKRGYR